MMSQHGTLDQRGMSSSSGTVAKLTRGFDPTRWADVAMTAGSGRCWVGRGWCCGVFSVAARGCVDTGTARFASRRRKAASRVARRRRTGRKDCARRDQNGPHRTRP